MTEQSETRRDLERSIRELLPEQSSLRKVVAGETPTMAAVGVGGLFTGYVWGWLRGRRSRPRRTR